MEFGANKRPVEIISWKIMIRIFIVQIIMMTVSRNMVLKVEHRYDFGKIRVGLMK